MYPFAIIRDKDGNEVARCDVRIDDDGTAFEFDIPGLDVGDHTFEIHLPPTFDMTPVEVPITVK